MNKHNNESWQEGEGEGEEVRAEGVDALSGALFEAAIGSEAYVGGDGDSYGSGVPENDDDDVKERACGSYVSGDYYESSGDDVNSGNGSDGSRHYIIKQSTPDTGMG